MRVSTEPAAFEPDVARKSRLSHAMPVFTHDCGIAPSVPLEMTCTTVLTR